MAVLSEPLHPSMGRLLLIKLESFFDEVVDGLLCERQSLRTEMIPEEIESFLQSPNRGFVGVLLQLQLIECLIQYPYSLPELPSCRGKDEDVVHEAEVLHVEILHAAVQIEEIEGSQQR